MARSARQRTRVKLLRTIRLDASDTFVFDVPAEAGALVDMLANQLIQHFGAPTIEAAKAAAEEEVAFAESLCVIPQDSVIAVHRSFENGAVRETFRALRGGEGAKPTRAFSFIETEGDDEPSEQIDLIALGE